MLMVADTIKYTIMVDHIIVIRTYIRQTQKTYFVYTFDRSITQLAKMSFDEIFDPTAQVYFHFCKIFRVVAELNP